MCLQSEYTFQRQDLKTGVDLEARSENGCENGMFWSDRHDNYMYKLLIARQYSGTEVFVSKYVKMLFTENYLENTHLY